MSLVNAVNKVVVFTNHRAKMDFWKTISRFRKEQRTPIPPCDYGQIRELVCSRGKRMDFIISLRAAMKIEAELKNGNEVIVDGDRLIHALKVLSNGKLLPEALNKLHIVIEEPILMQDLETLFNCKRTDIV